MHRWNTAPSIGTADWAESWTWLGQALVHIADALHDPMIRLLVREMVNEAEGLTDTEEEFLLPPARGIVPSMHK